MTKLAILDYGVGNLYSLRVALERRGADVKLVRGPPKKGVYDGLILPGVGSFSAASSRMKAYREEMMDYMKSGATVLGVCLGMQLFFEESEEGRGEGLSIFRGSVVRLPDTVKIPHMGWNRISKKFNCPILEGVEDGDWVYFVHSYCPSPKDSSIVAAETEYGVTLPAVICKGNIYGTQFHPEKSSATGSKIIDNFLRACRR